MKSNKILEITLIKKPEFRLDLSKINWDHFFENFTSFFVSKKNNNSRIESIFEEIKNTNIPKFPLTGNDLINKGIKEGKKVGEIFVLSMPELNSIMCHKYALRISNINWHQGAGASPQLQPF